MSQFHPDYGVTQDVRESAIQAYKDKGMEEAMRVGNVHKSTVYKWLKRMEK